MKFIGKFNEGEMEGIFNVLVDNKYMYRTIFENGIEIPYANQLKDINLDRCPLNLILCLLTIASLVIGAIFKHEIMIASIIFYILNIIDYLFSHTRNVLNHVDTLDSVINLLNQYKKWRPVVFFHHRMNNNN